MPSNRGGRKPRTTWKAISFSLALGRQDTSAVRASQGHIAREKMTEATVGDSPRMHSRACHRAYWPPRAAFAWAARQPSVLIFATPSVLIQMSSHRRTFTMTPRSIKYLRPSATSSSHAGSCLPHSQRQTRMESGDVMLRRL